MNITNICLGSFSWLKELGLYAWVAFKGIWKKTELLWSIQQRGKALGSRTSSICIQSGFSPSRKRTTWRRDSKGCIDYGKRATFPVFADKLWTNEMATFLVCCTGRFSLWSSMVWLPCWIKWIMLLRINANVGSTDYKKMYYRNPLILKTINLTFSFFPVHVQMNGPLLVLIS